MDTNCRCSQGSRGSQVGVWSWFCWWHFSIDTSDLQLLLELIVKEGEVADEDQHHSGKGSVHSRGGLLPQVEEFKYLWCLLTKDRRKKQERDDVSAEMGCSVMTIKGKMWNKVVRFHPLVVMAVYRKWRKEHDHKRHQLRCFPRVGEVIFRETRVKHQSQAERRGGACWGGPGIMAAAKMSFWGGTSHPAHPEADTGDAEGITHPINSWNALKLWEKIVGFSLLTSDPYEQRKMEQIPIKLKNRAISSSYLKR